MKPARPLFIILGVFVVICALGVTLLFTPSVQRWALLRALADRPDLKLEVRKISAGLSTLTVEQLRIEQDGIVVTIDELEADYSPLQLLFKSRLVVAQLAVAGLLVDATRVSPADTKAMAASAPAAAPGLLAQLKLPFALVLGDCRIEGRALFSAAAGQPPLAAKYSLSGGRFSPGQEGSFLLKVTVDNSTHEAEVRTLHGEISLRATQGADNGFTRVSLTGVANAQGKLIQDQPELKFTALLEKDSPGENYAFTMDTLGGGVTENVLSLKAAWVAGQEEYSGQWQLKARTLQLEPFLLGVPLPDFNARGEGHFSFAPLSGAASLRGNLNAGARRLEAIDPGLRAIDAVELEAEFDLAKTDGLIQLRQLTVRLDGKEPVLALQLARPAEFKFNDGKLQISDSIQGDVLNFQIHGLPLEWVQPFISPLEISGEPITGAFSVVAEKERVVLRTTEPMRSARLSLRQGNEPLLTETELRLGGQAIINEQSLETEISELVVATPHGDSVRAHATVSLPLQSNPPIALTVSYEANLPTLLAPWLPVSHVKAKGEADLTFKDSELVFRSLSTQVTDSAEKPLLKATALHGFTFDIFNRRAFTDTDASVDLLRISTGQLALDRFIASQPEMTLNGTLQPGEFLLTLDGEKLIFRALAPLTLSDFSLAQDGQLTLTKLALEGQPRFELKNGAVGTFESGEITVRNAEGAPVLTFQGSLTHALGTGLEGALTFSLDVPSLASQPVFSKTRAVSQGRASGEIRANFNESRQVEGRITVNGLVARDSGQTLPVANLSFRGIAQGDGRISLEVPLLLDRAGQRSDLKMTVDLKPQGKAFQLDGKLTGEHVELPDALAVLSVFLVPGIVPETTVTPGRMAVPSPADTAPAWAKFRGSVLLDIKSATSRGEWSMMGLTGSLLVDPLELKLEKFDAAFSETSRLSATAQLKFTGQPQPYDLSGKFSLTEFDTGKFFKAVDPGKPPTVEGLFTVAGEVSGNGRTLEHTFSQTRGRFELTSRQGIFRGLQRASNKVSMASKALEIGASVLGSILGSEKAAKATEKVAGQAYFVDQLAQSLGEFNYDQLSVRLVRDETLNMTLEDLSIISPEVRLVGKGTVTYVEGKRVLDQPLHASLSFACRGKIEQLLTKARLLEAQRDDLGFSLVKETVEIGGSLAKPDPTAFFTKLAAAKINDLLAPEN